MGETVRGAHTFMHGTHRARSAPLNYMGSDSMGQIQWVAVQPASESVRLRGQYPSAKEGRSRRDERVAGSNPIDDMASTPANLFL